MFDNLSKLGLGLVTFAIILGVGTLVVQEMGDSVAECATDYTYSTSQQKCLNASGGDATDPANTGWTTLNYMNGQFGTTGLAGWAPAIIALSVGLLFLGAFMLKKGQVY